MSFEHTPETAAVMTRYREERTTHARGLGVMVTPMTAPEVAELVVSTHTAPTVIVAHNLHSVYLFHKDPDFRALYRAADLVLVDGAPVRALSGLTDRRLWGSAYRIGSTDWLQALAEMDDVRGLRVFVLGAIREANLDAQHALRDSLPNSIVTGRDGFFSEADEPELLDEIAEFRPDLVLVGMGMPRQEAFLLRNRQDLAPAVWAAVGGAIDYVGGNQTLAPRIFGRLGLEWLWRLAHSPARLWRRYLVEPAALLVLLLQTRRERTGG